MPVGMIVGISGLVLLLSSERELKARVSWSILGIWEGFEVSVVLWMFLQCARGITSDLFMIY